MHPAEFQKKWIGVTLKERSAAQEHFIDLCRVLGVRTPAEADPVGSFYTFERGARKLTGGDGWANVWYRGHFAWEYKGKRANLKAAYDQLALYRESLENPPLLVVSDLNIIEIHTNFTGTVSKVHTIDLASFAEPESQDTLRRLFIHPDSFRPDETVEGVTKAAAERFSSIAEGLRSRGVEPHAAAHFLVQLLFCLFAEDVRLLPNRVFSRMVDLGRRRPDLFPRQVEELLRAMRDGGVAGYEEIPHFNGGLFQEITVAALTQEELAILDEATALDWSAIEPAIFGTLFERSLDPSTRAAIGAQYTGRGDIERVVQPVVMEPLRRRWAEVRAVAEKQKEAWNAATTPQTRRNRQAEFASTLAAFREELATVRVLDSACGSGNFLYVALAELLNLDKEVIIYGFDNGLPMGIPAVGPRQVLGLEINEYARELAQVAIWIGYLQWMIQNGFTGLREPVLESLETIKLTDSLLTIHDDESVTETTWPQARFIIGNPPFLGDKKLRGELGDQYTKKLWSVYQGRVPGQGDLVCYFFEKARAQIERGSTSRAGLLATSSIRSGANRRVLDRIKKSGDIFLAWPDQAWVLEGADVRISIVAFDDGTEPNKCLDGVPVPEIFSNLTGGFDASRLHALPENEKLGFIGVQPSGKFEISAAKAEEWLALPLNVNGRSNADVLRPFVVGADLLRRPKSRWHDDWIIDFGTNMSEAEAAQYEAPFEHVRQIVKPARDENNRRRTRELWWIHGESRPGMRSDVESLNRFVASPIVAKHRIFVTLPPDVLAGNKCVVFARSDDYFFGVVHSRAHQVWAEATATRHGVGNDPAYHVRQCFETFPLPWPPGTEPVDDPRVIEISEAAKTLNELRERWLNPPGASEAELKKRTLTNLYNARPQWLQNAHAGLDRAVWTAYGWDDPDPATVDEDTILSRLLVLNGERRNRDVKPC
jgi:type II restriction/modification system DNA methylase subunit YeeA